MYIHVSDKQTKSFFTSNKICDFRVKLPYTLNFEAPFKYEIALLDISMPKLKKGSVFDYMTININIGDTSIINLDQEPILQRLYKSKITETMDFVAPRYIPVTACIVDIFHIYLRDNKYSELSFEDGTLYATLHIRKCE